MHSSEQTSEHDSLEKQNSSENMNCSGVNNSSSSCSSARSNQSSKSSNDREETGKDKLFRWINKQMKIEMTDGRVLIGIFLCTDRDGNVILGSCSEYLTEVCGFFDEPRMLGLVMVPGRHIVSIHHAPDNIEGETA
ncbi:LSMD1 domain-containing protein Sbat [Lycorma delicatula]|uniref:LSMD1 domain-containing protein Sbat n=1 Tax=Lycorma delicatula TaxID=130591 RepID=UPI003F50EBD5